LSSKLDVLTFFRNHKEEEYTNKDLCKEFNLTTSAMWKIIRELWFQDWIIKNNSVFPTKYGFNELLLVLVPKTK